MKNDYQDFLYRYALLYSRYNKASSDAIRTKDEYYKDSKMEMLYRLEELEYAMNVILGNDISADICNKALDLSNRLTEEEIRDKIKKMNNIK